MKNNMQMIKSKIKTLLFTSLAICPTLVASELHSDNQFNKSVDVVDCTYSDAFNWFSRKLETELDQVIKVYLKENSSLNNDKWFQDTLSKKDGEFTKSVDNLRHLIIKAKDLAHKDIEDKTSYHNGYVNTFYDKIKSFYIKNSKNIDPKSDDKTSFKVVMGLINGLAVYETLWKCFNLYKAKYYFNFGHFSVGLNKDEINALFYYVLSDLKKALLSENFTVDGISLWEKLGGNRSQGEDELLSSVEHDLYCYLVRTLVITPSTYYDNLNYTSALSDVNDACRSLSESIFDALYCVRQNLNEYDNNTISDEQLLKMINDDKEFNLYLREHNKVLTAYFRNPKG